MKSVAKILVVSLLAILLVHSRLVNGDEAVAVDEVDKVIEDEITLKLSEDLIQSIERKFQVDLEKSVDSVLLKIKLLLQNGTAHIQDRLHELQSVLDLMKKNSENEVHNCMMERQNETTELAEKALHQMVVCGYALIGHDPAGAVKNVLILKSMIKQGLLPIYEQREEIYKLLVVCGHNHDSLKKVIKCVISKSPQVKSAMMEITGKLIDGIVKLTKLMAHGAMHEACLIEVVKSIQDEAFNLVKKIKLCVYGYNSSEVNDFIKDDNATVLDLPAAVKKDNKEDLKKEVQNILRRMLEDKEDPKDMKEKLLELQHQMGGDSNSIANLINK